jgi:DnaJ-class molecular chaperone
MPSAALKQIQQAWGKGKSLYEILGVATEASSGQIRKAYFRLALTCVSARQSSHKGPELTASPGCIFMINAYSIAQHPDKCPDDPEAKEKFQALSLIHATLSDAEKRAAYDESGDVADEEVSHTDAEW